MTTMMWTRRRWRRKMGRLERKRRMMMTITMEHY